MQIQFMYSITNKEFTIKTIIIWRKWQSPQLKRSKFDIIIYISGSQTSDSYCFSSKLISYHLTQSVETLKSILWGFQILSLFQIQGILSSNTSHSICHGSESSQHFFNKFPFFCCLWKFSIFFIPQFPHLKKGVRKQ